MRRIALWLLSTVSVVVLLFGYHTSTEGRPDTARPAVFSGSDTTTTGSGSTPSASPPSSPSTSPSTGATTKVAGESADTQWGPVQVELSVAGGSIESVDVLQYPHGNGRDQEINSYALPILIKETLAAQSAGIDMVSGATVTSDGYLRSLQSALDRSGLT